jgi:O-antigen ligase
MNLPPGTVAAPMVGIVPGQYVAALREALARLAALVVAAVYIAGPGLAIVTSPRVHPALALALGALTALAWVRPAWSPAVLLGLVPLLPVWPTISPAVPAAIVHLVVVTQVVPWMLRRALGARPASTAAAVPAWGVFLAIAAVSVVVVFAPVRWTSTELVRAAGIVAAQVPGYLFLMEPVGEARALPLFVALLDGFCCMLLVRGVVTRETRERMLRTLALGAVLTALLGMVQARTGVGLQQAWRVFDAGIVRINATYVDPNALAAFYALVGPVLIGLAMARAGRWRAAWAAGFAIVLAAMVMTAGRAGLVALVFGCAVLAWLALGRGLDGVDPSPLVRRFARPVIRTTAIVLLVGAVTLMALGTMLNVRHEQQTSYVHTWLYTLNVRQPADAIAKGRIAVWTAVTAMIEAAPWTGVGLGNSVNEFETYRVRLGIDELPPDARLSAHNTYLLVTSELGVLGLAAWLLMLAGVVIGIRAHGNLPARAVSTWPAAGLVAGLAGYSLTMLTGDRILLREDIVMGTMCAALATLGSGRLPRAWRWAAWTVLLVALVSGPVRIAWPSIAGGDSTLPPHEGLHDEQVGARGDTYRWSKGYTVLYIPPGAVRVRIPVRNISPQAQRVEVFVDGRPADLRDMPPDTWAMLDYRLPPAGRAPWHHITLQVSPTWQAPGDDRVLGIVIGEWSFESR